MSDLARSLRRVAKDLLPPVVVRQLRRARPITAAVTFAGDYRDYAEAARAAGSAGYEDASVIETMMQRTREHCARAETLARVVPHPGVFQNLTAFLIALDGAPVRPLRVLDFGGGAGLHYFTLLPFLARHAPVAWTVCEVPAMARAAREAFGSRDLRFIESLEETSGERFDIALASGSLQYAPEPLAIWQSIAARTDALIINRTPFTSAAKDRLTVQTVRVSPLAASYPAWFLSEPTWLQRFAERGFEVDLRWNVPEDGGVLDGAAVAYSGLLIRRSITNAVS